GENALVHRPVLILVSGGNTQASSEMETAPFAQLAFHPDLSIHGRDQARRDGQPQAGPSVFSCRGTIRLGKWFKNLVQLVARNPDASILNGKVQARLRVLLRFPRDRQDDLAMLGKLDRVSYQ